MAGFGHKHNVHKAYKPMAAQPQLDDDIVHPAMEQEINPGLTSAGEPISRVAPDINPANGGYVEDGQQADTSPGSGDAVGDRHVSLRDKIESKAEIFMGKVTKNEAKIEEGEARLEGEKLAG